MKPNTMPHPLLALCGLGLATLMGCSSMRTPATADVAVSKAAVSNASDAGAAQYAPAELKSARESLALANTAMTAKDYKQAREFAAQAEAEAKLAQSKANSAKATAAANTVQEDIRVLREELDRASKP